MQLRLLVNDVSQVGEVRRAAVKVAQRINFPEARQSDAAIVATELATNLARHARNGQILIQTLSSPGEAQLELVALDSGPGIADLRKCLQDGYSSGGTAGTGLGAIRRLSDQFDAYSTLERGTVIVSRLDATRSPRQPGYAVGVVSIPAPNETICGDCWRIVEQDQALAVMVADGLGHGPLAAEAANQAADVFAGEPFADAASFYSLAHQRLASTRGAAVARALVQPNGRIAYSGVGNIAGSLIGVESSRGLPSQNGTVGAQMHRQISTPEYDWPARGALLMHSDGILSRWSLDPYPGLLVRHPSLIAAIVFRDFLRGKDDATIVVVSRAQQAGA